MKNLLLTSLLVVAVVSTSFATNNKTKKTTEAIAEATSEVTVLTADNTSEEPLKFNTKNSNYFNVIRNLEVNSFVKLIQLNDYEAVKNLVITGESINKRSVGLTPLMHAAKQNKIAIVKLLLAEGAKLDVKSDSGFTALDYAKRSKATESYYLIKNALEL